MKKCCNNCAYVTKVGICDTVMCLRGLTLEEDHVTGNTKIITSNIVECMDRRADFLSGKCGYKANEMKCTQCKHSTEIRCNVNYDCGNSRGYVWILYCDKKEKICVDCYTNVNNCDNCYETASTPPTLWQRLSRLWRLFEKGV